MMVDTKDSFEKSIILYQTRRRHIEQDSNLHSTICDSLKSHKM
jgi:hypothetical protein